MKSEYILVVMFFGIINYFPIAKIYNENNILLINKRINKIVGKIPMTAFKAVECF